MASEKDNLFPFQGVPATAPTFLCRPAREPLAFDMSSRFKSVRRGSHSLLKRLSGQDKCEQGCLRAGRGRRANRLNRRAIHRASPVSPVSPVCVRSLRYKQKARAIRLVSCLVCCERHLAPPPAFRCSAWWMARRFRSSSCAADDIWRRGDPTERGQRSDVLRGGWRDDSDDLLVVLSLPSNTPARTVAPLNVRWSVNSRIPFEVDRQQQDAS
jgi:hypothetical protein